MALAAAPFTVGGQEMVPATKAKPAGIRIGIIGLGAMGLARDAFDPRVPETGRAQPAGTDRESRTDRLSRHRVAGNHE